MADKLPELIPCIAGTEGYSEAVIVWTDNCKAMVAVWDGSEFRCAAEYWDAEGEAVTHWMPLPAPPEVQTAQRTFESVQNAVDRNNRETMRNIAAFIEPDGGAGDAE